MSDSLVKGLEKLAAKIADDNGFSLCKVELLIHLNPKLMTIQIRHKNGDDVSLKDCAFFSNPMEEAIDNSHLITGPYILEISSPGIDEHLKTDRDFTTFKGFPIEVIYRSEKKSERKEIGLLHARSQNHVHLNIKGKINRIPRKDVLKVRLTSISP